MKKFGIILLLASLLLAGCGITVVSSTGSLTLSPNERWALEYEFEFLAQEVALYGNQLSSGFEEFVNYAREAGVTASWENKGTNNAGNVVYQLKASGTTYESFIVIMEGEGELSTFEQDNKTLLLFQMPPLLGSNSQKVDFTLKGGKVVETNGMQSGSNKVTWNTADTMYAVMELPTANGWVWLLLIAVVMGGVVAAAVLTKKKTGLAAYPPQQPDPNMPHVNPYRSPNHQPARTAEVIEDWQPQAPVRHEEVISEAPSPLSSPSAGMEFCPQCGTRFEAGAVFCMHCGFKRN